MDVFLASFGPCVLMTPWPRSLVSAFLSLNIISSKSVMELASSPTRVTSYLGPRPASSVSILIALLGFNALSSILISLEIRLSFKVPSLIVVSS